MGKLTTVQADGLELSLFPWESPELVIADIEAMLDETYAKPWLADEDLDLMTPDMDAIVNDPLFDRYLAEVEATRLWSGGPVCNWSFLESDGELVELDGCLIEEPGYLESTQPWLF